MFGFVADLNRLVRGKKTTQAQKAMPLFGNKFSPKKGQARKWPSLSNLNLDATAEQNEFGLEYGPIKIKLGEQEIRFDKGQWVSETNVSQPGGSSKDAMHFQKRNYQLQEENNLLKLKIEILLDMLAQTTAEVHLQQNEIEQLKKYQKKK